MKSKSTAMFAAACAALVCAFPAAADTLGRIKDTGHIRVGYLDSASPFSFKNASGAADGYTVALCNAVIESLKKDLALPNMTVDFTPVSLDWRMFGIENAQIDLMCSPAVPTLANRKDVAFSIPVFGGGNRAVMMKDSAKKLRASIEAETNAQQNSPIWRGSPAVRALKGTTFAVVASTASERWVTTQRAKLGVDAHIQPVPDYATGLRLLYERKVDVFFGDQNLLLAGIAKDESAKKWLVVLDRQFTHEPYALALAKGDDDFRLAVDRALSRTYSSAEFPKIYTKWFGEYGATSKTFFDWVTIPE